MEKYTKKNKLGHYITPFCTRYDDEEFYECYVGASVDRLGEYEDLEEQDLIIKLPCKVGDILYEVDMPEYGIIVCKVKHMTISVNLVGNLVLAVMVVVIKGHGLGATYPFMISDFSKTVFLTQEDAEKALTK